MSSDKNYKSIKQPEIFLSYSWASKKIADKIFYDLSFVGFNVIKDDHELKFTDKIPEFMKRIRKVDFVILLICDSYLKSINCMTEVMELEKENEIWKKILPVICKGTKIFELEDRIMYVKFWQEKSTAIETTLKSLDPINATEIYQELKSFKIITSNIDFFLKNLKEHLCVTSDDLFENFYSPITDKIGIYPDYSKMMNLIKLSFILDPKKRLQKVNNFIQKQKFENTYCYSIIAGCYRDLKQPKEAIEFYKKAIAIDDFNFTAWNNLGQIYELFVFNYSEAKRAYENAITVKPDLDIARLNLGLLLYNHFKDVDGAKKQFEEILKFDELNPKAHNNLAAIYRHESKYLDLNKAEKHFIVAVNQNNLEATICYANFLKANKKNIELGNKYYQKAKVLDTENLYTELIDFMLNSIKG